MKKIIFSLMIILLSSSLSADIYLKGGGGSLSADATGNPTSTMYQVGLGADNTFNNGLYLGAELNYGWSEFTWSDTTYADNTSIAGEVHLGYTAFNDLNIYGIAGYGQVDLDYVFPDGSESKLSGSGFKYGGGIEYKIIKYISIGMEYTIIKPNLSENGSGNGQDVKFNYISGNLKIRF